MENLKINKISYYKPEDIDLSRVSLSWLRAAKEFIQKQLVDKQQQLVFHPVEFPDCMDVKKTCRRCNLDGKPLCIVANCLLQARKDGKAGYFTIEPVEPV